MIAWKYRGGNVVKIAGRLLIAVADNNLPSLRQPEWMSAAQYYVHELKQWPIDIFPTNFPLKC